MKSTLETHSDDSQQTGIRTMQNEEMNISANPYPVRKGRTKWEILTARRDAVREYLARMESEMYGLEHTECGLKCSGCGEVLITEKDFAAHFIIPDERYLN